LGVTRLHTVSEHQFVASGQARVKHRLGCGQGVVRVVGGDGDLIQSAVKYIRSVKYDQFLADASALLNSQQKLSVLINMADSLLSDGNADSAEQKTFSQALTAFGMTEDGFKSHFETIALKNNRSIF
jgi:hypothetical protein